MAERRVRALPCFTSVLRANLLVMGSDDALVRFLDSLLPHLRQPVHRWAPGQCLRLPPPGVLGTLIIEDAGELPPDDQRRLFDWLTVTLDNTQMVSTTAVGLLSLVETGAFSASLYYRLNIVCIDLTAPSRDLDVGYALGMAVGNP
jgi:hypothetical protein